MQYVCLSSSLFSREFTASQRTTFPAMMNALMIAPYFFLGFSTLQFRRRIYNCSSVRSFCPSSTGSISSVLFWPPPPPDQTEKE